MISAQPVTRVCVHSTRREGPDAWPGLPKSGTSFLAFADDTAMHARVAAIEAAAGSQKVVIYAHSIGAVAAALAAPRVHAAGLVLVEPALYDIARGDDAIERHIGIVTEARSRAELGDLQGFWGILRPVMFGGPFDEGRWDLEQPVAERWARATVPWGHGVRPEMLDGTPTLVVTGGWNDEYETIAQRLSQRGARHVVLDGAGHRAQDLADFPRLAADTEANLRV